MRKSRSKYKVCGRLGYNALLRRWSGTKKKWEHHVMYQKPGQENLDEKMEVSVRNPIVTLKNEDRRVAKTEKKETGGVAKTSSRRRRKDIHGIQQSQKTGRKRIYGGVSGENIQKDRSRQRKSYKEWKRETERNYRKGRLRSEAQKVMNNQVDRMDIMESGRGTEALTVQKEQVHRIAKTEIRADVRRWRSGRVPSLQMGRDLIEHGYVNRMDEEGKRQEEVKWQGSQIRVGNGRKVKEEVWKNIKGRSRGLVKKNEYHMTAANYMEVDYITGRRRVLRIPESNEVVVPMGLEASLWTYV
jgi:hypothetical protein